MGVNKVVYDDRVLIDLTLDTVIPDVLTEGYTAHNASGETIVGKALSVSTHNTDTTAHPDIRNELVELSTSVAYIDETDNEDIDEKTLKEELQDYLDNELEKRKLDIVTMVIESLGGQPVFGYVDDNNNIILSGNIANGIYILKYENEDGSYTEIGELQVGQTSIVNLLQTALTPDDITTIFDGKGYKNGYYASAAEPFYNVDADFFCTGLMVIPKSGIFYIKGCTIDTSFSHTRFGLMYEDGTLINTATLSSFGTAISVKQLDAEYYSIAVDINYSFAKGKPYYFYFSASGTGENVVISETPIPDTGNESTSIDLFTEYTPLLNQRWSNSSRSWVDANGCVGFELPIADVVGKIMRFSGFKQGYGSEGNNSPSWYMYDDNSTNIKEFVNIFSLGMFIDEGNDTYSWVVPYVNGATKFMVFLPIAYNEINESSLKNVSWTISN